jgi:RNA polymerase sigma-70 factor (ECF subfamily)
MDPVTHRRGKTVEPSSGVIGNEKKRPRAEFFSSLIRGQVEQLESVTGCPKTKSTSGDISDGTPKPGSRQPCLAVLPEQDRALVRAIQQGDATAAAPLYQRLRGSIERALARVLRDRPVEFEDLMQITYERIIRTLAAGNFEGRSQLTTWASAIAAHVAVDWLRRRAQEQRLFLPADATSVAAQMYYVVPERRLEARSEVRRIHEILGRMNPCKATTLVMHDVLGHSVPEVAELLGIRVSATQSRLRRAREEFVRRHAAQLPLRLEY